MQYANVGYTAIYALSGAITVAAALFAWRVFPHFTVDVIQENRLFLRGKYWIFYVLTFLAGARRQIVVVFAGFLLVERFHFSVQNMLLLLIVNTVLNMLCAPYVGKLIERFGENLSLKIEYGSIVLIFVLYAMVQSLEMAVGLYVIDNLFFTIAITLKTFFQNIADAHDIAVTSSIGFTINHISAVLLPFSLGIIWTYSVSAVFLIGAFLATISFCLTFLMPKGVMHEPSVS